MKAWNEVISEIHQQPEVDDEGRGEALSGALEHKIMCCYYGDQQKWQIHRVCKGIKYETYYEQGLPLVLDRDQEIRCYA